ncbi:MAG: hypothetical protein GY698_09960 [Actinomycetia bacterium]|nr:hypothetical protein [Actinomycetes bacterium]
MESTQWDRSGTFIVYEWAGKGWDVPNTVISAWLGSTLAQIIGLALVVTRYLFPNRDLFQLADLGVEDPDLGDGSRDDGCQDLGADRAGRDRSGPEPAGELSGSPVDLGHRNDVQTVTTERCPGGRQLGSVPDGTTGQAASGTP